MLVNMHAVLLSSLAYLPLPLLLRTEYQTMLLSRFNTCTPYFKVESKITLDFEAQCSLFTFFIMNLLLLFHAHVYNQTQHTRTYRHKYIKQLTVVLVYVIVYTCLLNMHLVDDILYSVNNVKYIIIIYVLYCQLKGADRLEDLYLL